MKDKFRELTFVYCIMLISLAGSACGDLASSVNTILNSKNCSKATFAIKIINADTGRTVYSKDPGKAMIPASNMKIITSSSALTYLGKDYRFTTKVGTLDYDLVIIGGGDPLLGDQEVDDMMGRESGWVFDDIIASLKGQGIVLINDVVVDGTFFDDERVHPNWPRDQLNQPYACEVSGLNYNNNCLRVVVKRSGSNTIVSVDPETDYLTFINEVKIASSGSSAIAAYRNRTANLLTLRGKCVKEAGFNLAIEKPAEMFGVMLKERLAKTGIEVNGNVVVKGVRDNENIDIFWSHETSLSEVLARCNKDSLNMAAECLIKTISAENSPQKVNGNWEHGFELVGEYLESLGVSEDEYDLDDGSGLSRENKVSPNIIVTLLKKIYDSDSWNDYKKTLAVGGVDGTISKYFTQKKYKGKVFGKTGYINGVRTFSGVCNGSDGEYIFSILSSGGAASVRAGINDIVEAVIDQL